MADGRLGYKKKVHMQFLKIYTCLFLKSKIAAKVGNQIRQWIRDGQAPQWNQHTDFEGKCMDRIRPLIWLQNVWPNQLSMITYDSIHMFAGYEVGCISYRGGDMLLGYNDGGAEVFQKTTIPVENLQVLKSHIYIVSKQCLYITDCITYM